MPGRQVLSQSHGEHSDTVGTRQDEGTTLNVPPRAAPSTAPRERRHLARLRKSTSGRVPSVADVLRVKRAGSPGPPGSCRTSHPAAPAAKSAAHDYVAVHTCQSLHETPATHCAYRKEAERLILWAIVERGRALSSLTTEDAIAYRSFLRYPGPRERWVEPPRPRNAPDSRPFSGSLSARSTAYALSVLGALFRCLIEQRYVLTNPFAAIKVRGTTRVTRLDTSRGFTDGEWGLVRTIANALEWSCGWETPAAQRLRFLLDLAYATGLRVSEFVGARFGDILTMNAVPTGSISWARAVSRAR